MKKRYKGFTLVEILIVVAIIGVLAAIAFPSYAEYIKRGKRAECRASMLQAAQQMEKFYSNNNEYPPASAAGLVAAGIN
jgi:type IV pilus assembly protein PilE